MFFPIRRSGGASDLIEPRPRRLKTSVNTGSIHGVRLARGNPFRYLTLSMDLRPLITSKSQIEEARRLALRGLLSYQPYIFSDNFATGAGLSILAGHVTDPPAVYCADATANDTDPTFFAREFAKENQREEFFVANGQMRRFYDGMVDQIANAVGPLDDMSVLDVGCNTGYFPLAFARRGARKATGIDRIDYSPTVSLLNDICRTSVEFANWNYDGSLTAPEQYDLVLSVAVLVHLSEPLRHLTWLGSTARKALMVFTPCHDAIHSPTGSQTPGGAPPDYSIRFHCVNRYYHDAKFPQCFDITTLSEQLLRLAFEKMGFTRVIEITAARDTMPTAWARRHVGLLGIREDLSSISALHATAPEADLAERDKLLRAYISGQLAALHGALSEQKQRLEGLEATIDERSNRLLSVERTLEERSNRLQALERILGESSKRTLWRRLGSALGQNIRKN